MTTLSTHVLDTTAGAPARDVAVVLDGGAAEGRTDADGRCRFDVDLDPGTHRLTFDTGARSDFYPEVTVTFSIPADRSHVHVPLLLSPYSYSTYLGS
ncbi:hydroxyisourate hydrolase [Nocardioides sp. SR21]|uniref:hydroxyisourate hydrolase n=1 Tax=Nocardioides sp. SR21 TaxID=2919501 RepID=UPI001FAAE9D0|nr:hydroxyisourate hydrolase [Nocardioides sp. SR21]